VLFTNNAGSSLLQHIAKSYSDIESLQFADLIRDYFHRRKLRKYRFQEEVLRDLREQRKIKEFLSSYDPFIDYFSNVEKSQKLELNSLNCLQIFGSSSNSCVSPATPPRLFLRFVGWPTAPVM
jgi:hypothetical protein